MTILQVKVILIQRQTLYTDIFKTILSQDKPTNCLTLLVCSDDMFPLGKPLADKRVLQACPRWGLRWHLKITSMPACARFNIFLFQETPSLCIACERAGLFEDPSSFSVLPLCCLRSWPSGTYQLGQVQECNLGKLFRPTHTSCKATSASASASARNAGMLIIPTSHIHASRRRRSPQHYA